MSETKLEITNEGHAVVTHTEDVQAVLDHAAEMRANASSFNLAKGSAMTYVGSIPKVVVRQWEAEGFYIDSPAKSGMIDEDHKVEILRRLQAMPLLLTSNYKKLV